MSKFFEADKLLLNTLETSLELFVCTENVVHESR
jgi:hypothetical protein